MPRLLDGKAALITGAGGGIGRATALAFAREGARVAVADVAVEAAHETVAQVNAAGGQAISLAGDVTRDADVRAMIGAVVGAYGRLDCAFNNAGVAGWHVGSINQMLAQGGGAIVNTASIAGLVGLPNATAYVAAKHGVVGLTKTAALEYAEAKIRVNAVCPGYIKTPMTAGMTPERGSEVLTQTPMKRLGEAEEIAEMVVWLCSGRASYVSGVAYNVDGGWMAI